MSHPVPPTPMTTPPPVSHGSRSRQRLVVFDFLGLTGEVAERDLEQALLDRIVDTLRELRAGFAFVGRQVHLDVTGDDFFIDLLLVHTEQLRFVVIELKTGRCEPGFAGQIGF